MVAYEGFFNHWFGVQDATKPVVQDSTLWITDGDTTVQFAVYDCNYGIGACVPVPDNIQAGWAIVGPNAWQMQTASLKGGGYKSNPATAHGQMIRQAVFDEVTESWTAHLKFYSTDGMIQELDTLDELLKVRAVNYWTNRRNHKPVYIVRQLPGESNYAYVPISTGDTILAQNMWSAQCTLDTGFLRPVLVTIVRQPFWLGAVPGEVQSMVELAALQLWDYNLIWAAESALPTGDVFCFVETSTGNIYAGGASEILLWNGTVWAVVNTAPVVLAENVTSALAMTNGDILFGGNGRIIRRNSAGTWEVESNLPAGQVWGMILTGTGVVYAADNGQILKRGTDGIWSVDSTIPNGQVYSFTEYRTGRVFAGCAGEIVRTADPPSSVAIAVKVASDYDNAEQYGNTMYTSPTAEGDLDFLNRNYVGMRFHLDIPVGATINSAVVKVFANREDPVSTAYSGKIYCEDIGNSPSFAAGKLSSRTLTTAYTSWSSTLAWKKNRRYSLPGISQVLQEVVDRADRSSGSYVSVIVKCDVLAPGLSYTGFMDAYSYGLNADKAPVIEITYTPSPTVATSWERCTTDVTGNIRSMLSPSCAPLILAGDNGDILGSDDEGTTFGVISALPSSEVTALYEYGGYIYAGETGNILRSPDCGRNFALQSALPGGVVYDFIAESVTGDMRSGDNGQTLILDESLSVELGRDDTEYDEVFVCNHHKTCNLTNIHIDDGGVVGGNIFPITTLPTALFPAVPATDATNWDAIYFGVDTSLDDTGPFCNLIFDIGTVARSTANYTIVWEYWNAAWVALTCTDETNQFSEPGVNGVYWVHPADWTTTAIGGVTGYWVRARLSVLAGVMTPPTQQNRTVYSAVTDFTEVDGSQTEGNIESLIKLKMHQRADKDGVGGAAPNLYANRVWVSAKQYENHENFRAFLNFANEQNPDGVTVDVTIDPDTATSIEADTNLSSATGIRVFFDAGVAAAGLGLNVFADRVEFELDTELATHFYGTYIPILRCKQHGGSSGEVEFRIKVVTGSGGISKVGDTKATQSTTDHELIVFDEPITLPVSSQMKDSDIGDVTSIIVQIACAADDADCYLYDLFLQATDGPWLDLKDTANTSCSELGTGQRLLVDSISIPKAPTRAIVQTMASDSFVSSWRVNGNGDARLPAKTKVRLWFLQARTSAAASTLWLSEPEQCMSVTLEQTSRWLLGRGAS